jgi:hypothetical protein
MAAKIKEMAAANLIPDAMCPTDAECALALNAIRDEYLAALMLSGAHRNRLSGLCTDLKNQYGYGDDRYPKTINACLSLLNRWTPSGQQKSLRAPQSSTPNDQNKEKDNDEMLVYAQNANKPSSSYSSTALEDSSSNNNICSTYRRNLQMYAARSATSLVIHRRYVPNQNLPRKYTQSMPTLTMHLSQATPLASLFLHNKVDKG